LEKGVIIQEQMLKYFKDREISKRVVKEKKLFEDL